MTNEATNNISHLLSALAKAKSAFAPLKKSGKNPHLKNSYSTLTDMLDACGSALSANGLQIVQLGAVHESGRAVLLTRLYDKDGNSIESAIPLDGKPGDAQALGSWITYCRRYALAAMLSLEGDWDDDGDAALGRVQHKAAPAPRDFDEVPVSSYGKGPAPAVEDQGYLKPSDEEAARERAMARAPAPPAEVWPSETREVRCHCGEIAKTAVVKQGKNEGRKFHACPQRKGKDDTNGCDFFAWVKEAAR